MITWYWKVCTFTYSKLSAVEGYKPPVWLQDLEAVWHTHRPRFLLSLPPAVHAGSVEGPLPRAPSALRFTVSTVLHDSRQDNPWVVGKQECVVDALVGKAQDMWVVSGFERGCCWWAAQVACIILSFLSHCLVDNWVMQVSVGIWVSTRLVISANCNYL